MFEKKNFLRRESLVVSKSVMFILVLFHLLVVSQLNASSKTGAPVIVPLDTITGNVASRSSHVLQVYLDCRRCDFDFIRTELNFVNYVRDPGLADLHVFVTDESTGGGGREYQFTFIGLGPFDGTSYTLKHYIDRDATGDEIREALKQFLKMGFAS